MAKRRKERPVQRLDPGMPVHVYALHTEELIEAINYWSDRLPLKRGTGRIEPEAYSLSLDSFEGEYRGRIVQVLVALLLPQEEGGGR